MRRLAVAAMAMVGTFGLVAAQPLTASANPEGTDVVISEVMTRHFDFANDANANAVELFNPTDSDKNLLGWELEFYNSAGTEIASHQFTSADEVPAEGFLVIKDPDPSFVLRDVAPGCVVTTYTQQEFDEFPDDGGVLLRNAATAVVDGVGMTASIPPTEGEPAEPLDADTDDAAERIDPNGPSISLQRDIFATDTDNNQDDFSKHIANWCALD